jgi:hypothetical protein
VAQVPLAEDDDMVKAFPPEQPISRSVWPFCHGERGAKPPVKISP